MWRKIVAETALTMMKAFLVQSVVLGGGNAKKLKQRPCLYQAWPQLDGVPRRISPMERQRERQQLQRMKPRLDGAHLNTQPK